MVSVGSAERLRELVVGTFAGALSEVVARLNAPDARAWLEDVAEAAREGARPTWGRCFAGRDVGMWVQWATEFVSAMPAAAKTARRNLRVSPADDVLFREAAAAVGESVSEFLVESGRERAEMILADRTQFALDREAWKAFTAALERPAEVKPAVVELMRRPRPD